jgi:hypothetical protein
LGHTELRVSEGENERRKSHAWEEKTHAFRCSFLKYFLLVLFYFSLRSSFGGVLRIGSVFFVDIPPTTHQLELSFFYWSWVGFASFRFISFHFISS